jgi:5'-nucleotidase
LGRLAPLPSALRAALRSAGLALLVCLAGAAAAESGTRSLDILLTNDDGWDAPGIVALHRALEAAGHRVVRVAPATNRSGSGGSTNTAVGSTVPVRRHGTGVWSVDGTPADAVRAGLGALLPTWPDLVVSGANFGQNVGEGTLNVSGTVGAALHAADRGLPALAVSVALDLAERERGFPSTRAAFGPAAVMVRDLVDALIAPDGALLLPPGHVLNVNVPVPFDTVRGVRWARPAAESGFEFRWRDPGGVRDAGEGGLAITLVPRLGFRPEAGTDVAELTGGYVTLTLLDGDPSVAPGTVPALEGLASPSEPGEPADP